MTPEAQLAADQAAREAAEARAEAAEAELLVAGRTGAGFARCVPPAECRFCRRFGQSRPSETGRPRPVGAGIGFYRLPRPYRADFGENGGQTPAGALRGFFNAVLPQQLAADEWTAKSGLPAFAEGMSHHEGALAYRQANGLSYEEAARRTAD
ncbi:hypothetical protein [Neisseria leonii]|uniref:hypothetical protein n=1 Tax=Neisseria leonii TaxID=2995413 RepID=UPI00237C1BC0|nr:hypothetical protein [Neisseria sp. 3986]MDD9325346.1 hypothetical protein [Neisseria sp. 3986]